MFKCLLITVCMVLASFAAAAADEGGATCVVGETCSDTVTTLTAKQRIRRVSVCVNDDGSERPADPKMGCVYPPVPVHLSMVVYATASCGDCRGKIQQAAFTPPTASVVDDKCIASTSTNNHFWIRKNGKDGKLMAMQVEPKTIQPVAGTQPIRVKNIHAASTCYGMKQQLKDNWEWVRNVTKIPATAALLHEK